MASVDAPAEAFATRQNPRRNWDGNGVPLWGINFISSPLHGTTRTKAYTPLAYLASIVDSSDDAIIGIDLDGDIQSWNRGAEKLFGYSVEEALGLNVSTLMPPNHAAEAATLLAGVFRGETVSSFETERVRKDGQLVPVSLTVSALRNSKGQVKGACKIARDITERKRADEELRLLNHDLVQFAHAAAHDLQEPLRNISVLLDSLIESREGQPGTRSARELAEALLINESVESSQHMILMVRGLLAFTKLSDVALFRAETVDANRVLQRVLKTLTASIADSKIQIHYQPLPMVVMEKTHLEHLLQNLIGNAIKYRKVEDHGMIKISAARDQGEWVFTVADDGIGFEPIYSQLIFGIFKRLHTREEYPGTGIGLAICARIVTRYGGRIWADGELGRGQRSGLRFRQPALWNQGEMGCGEMGCGEMGCDEMAVRFRSGRLVNSESRCFHLVVGTKTSTPQQQFQSGTFNAELGRHSGFARGLR
jgi:PAS domain S-box-containing protein